jgi:hypothetical protein
MLAQQENVPYLCIEALEDNLQVSLNYDGIEGILEYSPNKIHWDTLSSNELTQSINENQKLYFRGKLIPHYVKKTSGNGQIVDKSNSKGIGIFTITKKCKLSGNPASLLFHSKSFKYNNISDYPCAFRYLFSGSESKDSNVLCIDENFLPATSLSPYCYYGMFSYSKSLANAPILPAKSVPYGGYSEMFANCSSLLKTPDLNATSISYECYRGMFKYCTELKESPSLPATNLSINVTSGSGGYNYMYMFLGCTNLEKVGNINATKFSSDACNGMF